MAYIPGSIPVTGFIGPTDDSDAYAVTDAIYGIDGYRSLSSTTVRNAITTERRREGMLVYTQSDQNVWQLLPEPWTGADADWKLFISSAATSTLTAVTTASNGLTKTDNNITLGGTLSGDTFIDNSGFLFRTDEFSAGTISAQTIHVATGKVSINTSNSPFTLSVQADNSTSIATFRDFDGEDVFIFGGTISGSDLEINIGDTNNLSNAPLYRISQTNDTHSLLFGNVYIGDDTLITPFEKLDVSGNTIIRGNVSGNTLNLISQTNAQIIIPPVNASAPIDNSMWFTTSGGTTYLNYRVSGTTKSVELT